MRPVAQVLLEPVRRRRASRWPIRFGRLVLLAGAIGGMTGALAQDDVTAFVQGGDGDRAVKSVSIGATRNFQPFGWFVEGPWSFYGEVVLGEWFVHEARAGDRARFTQVGLTPVLRYRFDAGPFIEAGIGLDIIAPRFRDNDRVFSTRFNFGDHVAVGTRFGAGRANELSLRAEHFSNGGIRHPNPGQNFIEVRYARHF